MLIDYEPLFQKNIIAEYIGVVNLWEKKTMSVVQPVVHPFVKYPLLFTNKIYIRKAITRNGIHFVCNKCGLRNYRVIKQGRAHERILRHVIETYYVKPYNIYILDQSYQ